MLDQLPDSIQIDVSQWLGVVKIAISVLVAFATLLLIRLITRLFSGFFARVIPSELQRVYKVVIAPYQFWIVLIVALSAADSSFLLYAIAPWVNFVEFPLSFALAALVAWFGTRITAAYFDDYLLDTAIQNQVKINSDLLLPTKLAANTGILIAVIFIFAQTHDYNLVGLFASLGVGGLAVAFAAQQTLQQFLGGIVLYIDRPFLVDDYIGLSDGTFGRVEAIGLRSTKIRTSGKGTLMVVPNSLLTSSSIENFTGAKKIISMIYLTFYRTLADEERALVRQVIGDSTRGIFGIDPRSTEIVYKDLEGRNGRRITQAQVSFFILGSGGVSMDLRRQLIDVARQSVARQLQAYDISFDVEDRTINVDSPITI